MIRRKTSPIRETKFKKATTLEIGKRTITSGEIVKVTGQHGTKFKFISLVTNTESGAQWVDCLELKKGAVSMWRSFKPDRIKPMPIKRSKKGVDRTRPS
jgi:hypothetical protein